MERYEIYRKFLNIEKVAVDVVGSFSFSFSDSDSVGNPVVWFDVFGAWQ